MSNIVSVAEVQQAGITIEAEEAVAIAQQVIEVLRRGAKHPPERPYGPPTPATVHLVDDGSVLCRGCETTPAVSEIAILLQAMVPVSTRVPGGLRYTIARALLDVDVPPFDSLDDLSETLARYERGPRDEIVRRLVERYVSRRALVPLAFADRRRHPHATELRRALRDADARLYIQKVATEALPAVGEDSRRHRPPRRVQAGAACVAAGLVLIATGEFIDSSVPAVSAPAAATSVRPEPPNRPGPRDVALVNEPAVVESRDARDERRPTAARAPKEERRTRPLRRGVSAPRAQGSRESARKSAASRSVLERLRLNWLRNVITSL